MTTISTKASVLGLKKETTEGTWAPPAATTDFIALQDDFTMDPAFESLENAELKNSIGVAKPIQGSESPTATLSHYLRASGVEGQAPNYGALLEAALGAVSTAGTEYDTVSSSTTSVLKVNTGEGANYERGEFALVKDSTNGYRLRAIDSISTDDLNLGFRLPNAPASGVNLGKCVLYKPAQSGHPTLSLSHYVGNSGALQVLTGGRVTSADFTFNAGELINASYSVEGITYYFNPITIASADRYIDFTDDDGTFAAAVATGTYATPHDLADAIETAMNDTASTEVYTVSYSDTTGKFSIVGTGTVLSLLWNSGTNTANTIGDKIGFVTASDDTGTAATTGYTGDNAVSFAASYTPAYDSSDPLVAKDNEVMIGDTADYACFGASTVSLNISTPKADILSVCATSGKSGSIIASREATVTVSALLSQYDASKFYRFKNNTSTKFQYSFGSKSGGNWIAGKCGGIYLPTCTITSINLDDADGLVQLNMELKAFVNDSGQGEVYVAFN